MNAISCSSTIHASLRCPLRSLGISILLENPIGLFHRNMNIPIRISILLENPIGLLRRNINIPIRISILFEIIEMTEFRYVNISLGILILLENPIGLSRRNMNISLGTCISFKESHQLRFRNINISIRKFNTFLHHWNHWIQKCQYFARFQFFWRIPLASFAEYEYFQTKFNTLG